LSIICWRDIKAVFLQFISCADNPTPYVLPPH
jgi:hypothetical protein